VLVIDEYLAVRALVGAQPTELDIDETLGLPAYRHYRLLQRIHTPGSGQLSRLLSDADQEAIRRPHPEVLHVLDPRPLLDEAAAIGAAYGSAGLLVGETLAAGLVHGRRLWFGSTRNVGARLAEIADDLGIDVHVSEP
jgi:class 3 adenylate cyclase